MSSSGYDIDDAVSKRHVQGTDTSLGIQSEPLDMNLHKIIGLDDPTGDKDAVNKEYVDTLSGYTNLTQFINQTAWRLFYSDAAGDVTELALGISGQYLKSIGVDAIPVWDVPGGGGDVLGPATNTDNYVPQWNGANSKILKNGFAITDAGKALIDDADAAVQRVTLGLDALVDNSIVNDLHRHSELVASDGSPDPALVVDAAGNIGIGEPAPVSKVEVRGPSGGTGFSGTDGTQSLRLSMSTGFGIGIDTWDTNIPRWGLLNFNIDVPTVMMEGSYNSTDVIFNAGSVAIGTTDPVSSAKLEIASTTGALLLPRMTTVQKNALVPVNGMTVYDSTLNEIQGYENGVWTSGAHYTNLTQFVDQTAWRLFYSNVDGDVIELALGANGQYLKATGATSAPAWDTPSGAGDVIGPASAVNEAVPLFNGTTGKILKDSTRLIEDALTDGSNIPDGHAIKTYGDTNWGGNYTNLTQFVDQTGWRLFYSNAAGDVTELALGINGQYLKSAGTASIPTWDTPAGSGDVTGPGSATNNAISLFNGTTGKIIKDSVRCIEDALTDGSNIPDGHAIKTYGDTNWGGGSSEWTDSGQYVYPNSGTKYRILDAGTNLATVTFDADTVYTLAPGATYNVNTSIIIANNHVSIIGNGATIRKTAQADALRITGDYCRVVGMEIDGNSQGWSGVFVTGSRNIIDGVVSHSNGDIGIGQDGQVTTCQYNRIVNCECFSNGGIGISMNDVDFSVVSNNVSHDNTLEGFTCDANSPGWASSCTFDGNVCSYNHGGVGGFGMDRARNCTLSNNVIDNNDAGDGIKTQNNQGPVEYCVFSGNIFINNTGYGINITSGTGGASHHNKLVGNIYQSNVSGDYYVISGQNNVIIETENTGSSKWTDEATYYRPNNVTNSGNTGYRIYDAGYTQLGQIVPTAGNNFGGGGCTDGTVLRINHGNLGSPSNDAQVPLWVKRYTNKDGTDWGCGAAYIGTVKTGGTGSLQTMVVDTYCQGGSVPVSGGFLGGLLSHLKNDSVTGSAQDIHNITAITYTPSSNYSSVHACVMVDVNNRYASKGWLSDYVDGWTCGVRVANESASAKHDSCAFSVGSGAGNGKWYMGLGINDITYDASLNKGEGIYFRTSTFASHVDCLRAEYDLDLRAGWDIANYYTNSFVIRKGRQNSYTDVMWIAADGSMVLTHDVGLENTKGLYCKHTDSNYRVGVRLNSSNDWELGLDAHALVMGYGCSDPNPIMIRINGLNNQQLKRSSDVDSAGRHYVTVA